jgi:hypothetical protein
VQVFEAIDVQLFRLPRTQPPTARQMYCPRRRGCLWMGTIKCQSWANVWCDIS